MNTNSKLKIGLLHLSVAYGLFVVLYALIVLVLSRGSIGSAFFMFGMLMFYRYGIFRVLTLGSHIYNTWLFVCLWDYLFNRGRYTSSDGGLGFITGSFIGALIGVVIKSGIVAPYFLYLETRELYRYYNLKKFSESQAM
ncbi:hypothetical protein [Paenibacillus sp. Soil750]|uniref:hypothetical protein n=1 Tax=Paenibacillus sp. Soil750 TaxID=1736398 RepID=UPI0006FC540D|nr:hypothetical protein [Paenibacillus sp. Soil750]KRE70843.1 hypothetical protein ASL11_11150 [Paenibacillus sp. Soil750]